MHWAAKGMILNSFYARCPFTMNYFLTFVIILSYVLENVAHAIGPQIKSLLLRWGYQRPAAGGQRIEGTEQNKVRDLP